MRTQTRTDHQRGKPALFKTALDKHAGNRFFAREGVDPLTAAFEKKITVHAGFSGHPVPDTSRNRTMEQLLSRPRQKQSAIYIHVPFCETHCLYCGFYNRAYGRDQSVRFTDTLLREIDLWQAHAAANQGPVHAVYIGGGTPTALESHDLERLLKTVTTRFPLANDCEITVEGRIHNFTPEKMDACLAGGANRFSIGVQTFHTDLRQSMRRIADRDRIIAFLGELKAYGRAVVVIDLIYGFPGQTMEMWHRDIDDFLSLDLDGLDLYQLNLFPASPLARAIEKGTFPAAAGLPFQAELFAEGVSRLEAVRYRRLTVGHWGRTTRERNIYNHLMKGPSECLGYGPGAGGCLNGHYFFVESDLDTWRTAVDMNKKPLAILMAPHPMADLDKTIAAGFDLGRINLTQTGSAFPGSAKAILAPLIEQWQRAGLIQMDGDWLELTMAGQFWHVNLAQLMIDFLHRNMKKEQMP
jgi:anaerobilin synthase